MSRAENGLQILVLVMILGIALHAVVFTVRSDFREPLAPVAVGVSGCPAC